MEAMAASSNLSARSVKALSFAATAWYTPVLLGQWIFVAYIFYAYIFYAYGWPLLEGNIASWNGYLSEAFVPGLLILWFAWQAVRYARQRQFDRHRRWATRLFLAARAVRFFRVIVMIWFVLTGDIGIDAADGTGWFLDVMSALQFLPIALYEVYWRIKMSSISRAHYALGAFLWLAAIARPLVLASPHPVCGSLFLSDFRLPIKVQSFVGRFYFPRLVLRNHLCMKP
jgi:hypothetical protein